MAFESIPSGKETEIENKSINNQKESASSNRYFTLLKASGIALTADLSLIILKSLLACLTGSTVLWADAWHSGGDFAVTFTVLTSIIVSERYKSNIWARNAEGIVALLISLVLAVGSIGLIASVFKNSADEFLLRPAIPLIIAIAGCSVACGISFIMFRFKRKVGLARDSIAFIAESVHTLSDFFTSLGVWMTLILGYFGVHIERLMTLVVGLIILRIGLKISFLSLDFFDVKVRLVRLINRLLSESIVKQIKSLNKALKAFYSRIKGRTSKLVFIREDTILKHRQKIIFFDLLLIVFLYWGTGYYSVLPYQTGVELAFGKVVSENPPGFHYHLPKPFGKVILVDTEVLARLESGYRTLPDFQGAEPDAYLWEFTHNQGKYVKLNDEAITITGDENLVDVNALCYYRIVDPVQYTLNVQNSHEILRNLFCYELHLVIARYSLDSLLTTGRESVQTDLKRNLQALVEEIPLGVEVRKVCLEETHPPLEVVPQYRQVASAREHKSEIIHRANAYFNEQIPKSRGTAGAELSAAAAFSSERISAANGAAQSFLLKQKFFLKYQNVQSDRLWWETVEKTLKNKKIYILPKGAKRRIFTKNTYSGEKAREK